MRFIKFSLLNELQEVRDLGVHKRRNKTLLFHKKENGFKIILF